MDNITFLNQLPYQDARSYFCRTQSYFDMELPPYFNFQPLLEYCLEEAGKLTIAEIMSWKPGDHEALNYTLMYNKDGDIGWRPFELIHPLIYAKCVEVFTEPDNWNLVAERFRSFSNGIVECCSMPVVELQSDRNAKRSQILNWWKLIEQRSLELSFDFSHVSLTDVSNCYPSIYSHSISWALHGREYAKKKENRRNNALLGVQIDKLISNSREGQTNGIPQASLLSHLIAELVLGYCDTYIDRALYNENGIKILRYRDDFRVFANSDSDCAKGIKAISECLNSFGMKLGSAKTLRSSNVVIGAVKQDKIDALSLVRTQKTLQKELLIIHRFCIEKPNSGATKFLIREFLDRLERKLPRNSWKIENPQVLVAILLDIAARTPAVFPAVATAISKIMLYLNDSARDDIFNSVERRTKRIPNSEYMQIWLQRIAYPNNLGFHSEESMCKTLSSDESVCLWENSWINKKSLRDQIGKYSIVDRSTLEELPPSIQSEEFDSFWKEYG